ncbi:MAG: hypothetical protein ICV63_00240 [Coleofasciculus sp. Co-bin14]|nr:hypothetical protein [Coleofasciculus sp. Co-bin14]
MVKAASAAEVIPQGTNPTSCVQSSNRFKNLVCTRVSQAPNLPQSETQPAETASKTDNRSSDPMTLEFTEEESDAAVAQFGCDCPACLNALRQLRGQPPLS